MRILVTYPGPMHSTYDVAVGYESALRNLGNAVHGYVYHQYLAFYDKALEHWQSHNPDYKTSVEDAPFYASQHLIPAVIDFRPDVVLIVSGSALHRRAYDLLYKLGIPVSLLLTESPYEDEIQAKFVEQGCVSHAFTNEILSVEWLNDKTGVEVTYLPHSFDPDVHKPIEVNGDYVSDVFFHGTLWPERQKLFDKLSDLPYNVRLTGLNVIDPTEKSVFIDNADLARFYNGTQICLNHHRTIKSRETGHITIGEAESIGPRAYEIAACGAFQLCDGTRLELNRIFGDSVPTYTDAKDLRIKIEYFMSNESERQELARLSQERVKGCTFINRAREIIEPALRRL